MMPATVDSNHRQGHQTPNWNVAVAGPGTITVEADQDFRELKEKCCNGDGRSTKDFQKRQKEKGDSRTSRTLDTQW